jgi:hypothetical protein
MDRERGWRNAGPDGRDAFASERHALEIASSYSSGGSSAALCRIKLYGFLEPPLATRRAP